MCPNCKALLKAIDAYIEKADTNLASALESEGYAKPKETVDYISALEESTAKALLAETDYFLKAIRRSDSLASFRMEWDKVKENDRLQSDLQAVFQEQFEKIVREFADFYLSGLEPARKAKKLSKYWKQKRVIAKADGLKITRVSQQTIAWVQNWSQELSQIMQLNSHKEIENILTQGLEEGIGIPEFARRIQNSGIRDEWYKARRVAVTEVLTAHRAGQQEAYLQSPSTKMKMWRHTGIYINGPRQNHKDMDGNKVPKDQTFELTGADGQLYHPMYPGDTSLPPAERIECHCAMQGISDKDVLGLPLEERQRLQQEAVDKLDEKWFNEQEDQSKARAGYTEPGGGAAKLLSQYTGEDGTFDIEAAKADYQSFLQNVPQKNQTYLQQSFDAVEYERRMLENAPFAYDSSEDAIVYDPTNPRFQNYVFAVVLTHELSHRIDTMFVHSKKQADFSKAIKDAAPVIDAEPNTFIEYCKQNDKEGFLSDILSAICEGRYEFPFGHSASYWAKKGKRAAETFANLFSLEAYDDTAKLEFLKTHFPEIIKQFEKLDFFVQEG